MRAFGEFHAPDAHCRPAHGAHVGLSEADAVAFAGRHDELIRAACEHRLDEFVVVVELNGYLAVALDGIELLERRLFDEPVARCEHEELALSLVGERKHRLHLFAGGELQQVDDRSAARGLTRLGDLVPLHGEHLAEVGEEEQILVRIAHEDVLDEVVVLRLMRGDAHAAPAL